MPPALAIGPARRCTRGYVPRAAAVACGLAPVARRRPIDAIGGQIVTQHEASHVVDTLEDLLELQPEKSPVLAQFDQIDPDPVRDPVEQLGGLEHRGHVAHRDGVGDLERGQRRQRRVEALAEAPGGLQGLAHALVQATLVLQHMAVVVAVHGDEAHGGGDRHHRHVDGPGHPLGRAVARAGLDGGNRGVGHEVDIGARDASRIGRQDHRPVHLRQLREPLRTELGIEEEPPRTDRQDLGAVTDDEQKAALGLQHALDAVAQRLTRRDQIEGVGHGRARSHHHLRMVPGASRGHSPAQDNSA